jgi:hypothetical protein
MLRRTLYGVLKVSFDKSILAERSHLTRGGSKTDKTEIKRPINSGVTENV